MLKWFLFFVPLACAFADENPFQDAIKSFLAELVGGEEGDTITTTEHHIQLNGTSLEYSAIAGKLPQFSNSGEVLGEMFFTAYLKKDEASKRPVTFIFNGGPGGSSLAMHIGGFGPKRLLLPEEGQKELPPYKMIENPETLLDDTDLVFVDPIGTGYSRAEKTPYKWMAYSVEGDLESFAEFTRVFCIHFDRWNSPKYLIGASYGTTRACGLAERLADRGIHLNGIVLMSSAIDFSTVFGGRDEPLSDCLKIPSYAATAWYHGRTMQDKTLEEVVDYARRFISDQTAPIMFQPSRLGSAEEKRYFESLAELIGLPVETIRRYEARLNEQTYVREFFASERKMLGGVDSRYTGDVSSIGGEYGEDPSYRDIRPAFYPSFMNYLQTDLGTKIKSAKYESFSIEAFLCWNWQTYDSDGTPSFLQRLRRTLVTNPNMKVFIGSGYYDLRTPFGAAEYSLEHLELPAHYRQNFQIEYYEAGHGFIFDLASLQKFHKDLKKFYAK